MRTIELFAFDQQYVDYAPLCGVDEVGRGPLAGPVAAGAVIMPMEYFVEYVNDSKKVSPKRRGRVYEELVATAVDYRVEFVGNEEIDQINILEATKLAMRRAVQSLTVTPGIVMIDAMTIGSGLREEPLVHGDTYCYHIAAASILAKIERDRYMLLLDEIHPGYGFARNKGYGTPEHIAALKKLGPCAAHRRSFIKRILEK